MPGSQQLALGFEDGEKVDGSHGASTPSDVPSSDQIEDNKSENYALVLTETEAAQHFRQNPESSTPIHIGFADDDPTNPRHWPSWRKWYVLSLCCFLNFLTVSLPCPNRHSCEIMLLNNDVVSLRWWIFIRSGRHHRKSPRLC